MSQNPLLFIALDTPELEVALRFAEIAAACGQGLKLGLEFFNANGPQGIARIRTAFPEASIFLDLKYHDIPNTVAAAIREVSKLGIDYVNVHAAGGQEMMRQAVAAAEAGARSAGVTPPKVLAVTILTSLDADDLDLLGYVGSPDEMVLRLAHLTKESGLAGIVCSSMEIEMIRRHLPADFVLMVPGIRPAGAAAGDQKRIMTPAEAVHIGATHLVVGRPVTQASDPKQAILDILESCE
ncbi:MAG: orotidine-5'-phosphate decarboxylase [Rhodospirillales bacterium]|nr:orotidine-5'-phosphate decarboxylase [Rhodospirillales bacterium]